MKKLQIRFLEQIAKKNVSGKKLPDVLSDILGISKGEAYKKINAKNLLSIPQIEIICNYFNTTFTINGKDNRSNTNVNFTPFHSGITDVKDYIESLESFLKNIVAARERKLSCATDDIPVFHLFKYPELTAFKLHFWQMRVLNKAVFKFNMNNWSSSLLKRAENLHNLYSTVPSTEIWTKTSLLNTLDQIKYAGDVKIISDRNLGKLICNQLHSALSDVEILATTRNKSLEKNIPFDWYFYEIIGSITYLAEYDGLAETFIRFNTFNTLNETNGLLCYEVKHWLNKLVQDATGFSGQGSVQRNKYLSEAYNKCNEMSEIF